MIDNVLEYAHTSPTQQEATTEGTVFGAYNAVTGYFQNVRNYKDKEANSNLFFRVRDWQGHRPHLTCVQSL